MILDDPHISPIQKPHPTHLWFLISSICVFLLAGYTFFRNKNSAIDIQLHDTYYVIAFHHILIFLGILCLFFAGMYAFLNYSLPEKLNRISSILHFLITISSMMILYFVMVKLVSEAFGIIPDYTNFYFYQDIIFTSFWIFVVWQIIFLGNIIWSFYHSFLEKNKP